jgi:hypothetical protein
VPKSREEEGLPVKDSLLSWAVVVGLVVSLAGCARYYWSKPGTTAEQFSQDSRDCVQQARSTLPSRSAVNADAIETLYRACLGTRGYVRDKQFDPPPPGSYRGIESGEEFTAAAQAAGVAPRQSFEQQLNQLDDLKARGRISEEEYAVMRRRLVEGLTPSQLGPAAPNISAAPPPSQPLPAPLLPGLAELVGIWRGEITYRSSRLPGGRPSAVPGRSDSPDLPGWKRAPLGDGASKRAEWRDQGVGRRHALRQSGDFDWTLRCQRSPDRDCPGILTDAQRLYAGGLRGGSRSSRALPLCHARGCSMILA